MFVLALVIAVVLHLVLQYTRGGRHLYAVGSNPEAARQAGLANRRVQIAAFVACGALAGLPGSCTSGASARSTSPPGPASSWRRSPPPSSAASARSAARAR